MKKKSEKKWDLRFLGLSWFVSTWSKDPSTKVGSVIVDDKRRIVSIGFNGFPRSMNDDKKRYENRPWKLDHVMHAEENAILFANRPNLSGCTVYVWPLYPCTKCCSRIIQSGIGRVVSVSSTRKGTKDETMDLYDEAGVFYTIYNPNEVKKNIWEATQFLTQIA